MAQVTAQNANLQVGEWYHVAFTLDLDNKKVLLWINNMNVASTGIEESSIPKFESLTNVKLGHDGTSSFEGRMDNIVIYERDVTHAELVRIMNYRDPELYLKGELESYITFDKFRTDLEAEGIVVDHNVVSEGSRVKDFSNKSVRISAPTSEPIRKSNDGVSTNYMSVGSWIKPSSVSERDMEVVSKDGMFSLRVNQGGEMSFILGEESISSRRFLMEKEYREIKFDNSGSLKFPETAAARGEVELSSGAYFAEEFTMSMWFKVDGFNVVRTLMSGIGFSTENSNKGLCVENGCLYMYDAANTLIVHVTNIVTDKWYHLVLTDEFLMLNYRKYEYTKTPIWSNNKILKLGNNENNNKNFLGHIDEFVLYRKRLDFRAIYELFNGMYPKEYESLVIVKYEFDDESTPGLDSSVAGLDLTLSTASRATDELPFEFKVQRAPMKGPEGIVHTHYDFVDEVKDSSGNDNHPLNHNVTFVNSFNNVSYRAAEFDGTSTKISCKPDSLSETKNNFTACTWIELSSSLQPNTRYPIFAQEGVMMAWLQTDANLALSTKVYISPKTNFMIKSAVWNRDSLDVTMSIRSVTTSRVFYAALMLKKLDLSLASDLQILNDAMLQIGVAPQSDSTVEYPFTLTEGRGTDGTMYPLSMVDNAYLYMRVVGDVYDLTSARNLTVYDYMKPVFGSTALTMTYESTGPIHNFDSFSVTNNSVTYLTDTVFSEEMTVAEYIGKSSHNVTFTPRSDFLVDIVFKQTGGTTDRHSVFQMGTDSGVAVLFVALADFWRFSYLPSSGGQAATKVYEQGVSTGMQPAFEQWGRHTYVFRKDTGNIEFYYNGVKGNVVAQNTEATSVEENVFQLQNFNPFDVENVLKIGFGSQGEQTEGIRIASVNVVLDDKAFPEYATTTFGAPDYVAEKKWTLVSSEQIQLNGAIPSDVVMGWGKFDNYLKSEGTKSETGMAIEMWTNYFPVPIERVWGTDSLMIIKTIDGRYFGVGSNLYHQMGMPYEDMASMTNASNVAETYYFKVPVELPHFASYDIKKMILRRRSTMFLTTQGELYAMGQGQGTDYCHFGTGADGTVLRAVTQIATDKVIADFHQSGDTAIILTADNKLFTAGKNYEHGALGNGDTTNTNTFGEVASNITSTETVQQVYTTDGHSASGFFTASGRAFACGWGYQNQYHNGQTHPATNTSFVELKFPDGRKIKKFFMTPIRTWMVDENNDIYVGGHHYNTNGWPSGVFGASGHTSGPTLVDSSINDGTEVLEILGIGTTATIVVREGGIYTFGRNEDGRLGNGNTTNTSSSTGAYKIEQGHPIVSFVTNGMGPYILVGYRSMEAIVPTLTDMDKITDVNTIGMGHGVTQEFLMGDAAHLSDESTSNTSNSDRITTGEVFDFFKMVNDNVDGGPMSATLSNGDRVYFTGHVKAGAQLFEPYNTTNGNGLISQGRYTGHEVFGQTMPNVGHVYAGAVMYELAGSERPTEMHLTGFKYRVSHVWGSGFRGDIFVFYREDSEGYDNFVFHEKIEHHNNLGNRATTNDLMFTGPTPAANAFLLVFVPNAGGWQELLRLQLFMREPSSVREYPKLPPYLVMERFVASSDSVPMRGSVYSEHAQVAKVYMATFDLDSFISEDITDEDLIALIESADVPQNAKRILGPFDRYAPTSLNVDLTHTVSARGASVPILQDMMVYGCMVAVDVEGRVNRQSYLTGRKNMLVMGHTREAILSEIAFVRRSGIVETWEEVSSNFTINTYITIEAQFYGFYLHKHPIFMQGNWTVIYWAKTSPNASGSFMITEHPTVPANAGNETRGRNISEPYKYNTVEMVTYNSQYGNGQSWEYLSSYSGDGTFDTEGWGGNYDGSQVRFNDWVQMGIVYDATTKELNAYHFRSATNYSTYTISNVEYTATTAYLRVWRNYIRDNQTMQIDGIRVLNNEALTPEQISLDTRTSSEFTTVV